MLNENSTTENTQGAGNNEVDTTRLTTNEQMVIAFVRTMPTHQQQALADVLAIEGVDEKTAYIEGLDSDTRAALTSILNLFEHGETESPAEKMKRETAATRAAWRKLDIDDQLLDASHATSLDAIEMLTFHVINQLFSRQYLTRLQLHWNGGASLNDLYDDILDILQTGIDELPVGYASELIGKGREG